MENEDYKMSKLERVFLILIICIGYATHTFISNYYKGDVNYRLIKLEEYKTSSEAKISEMWDIIHEGEATKTLEEVKAK